VVSLNPIHKKYGIKRIVYSTYQAVSGAGLAGYNDLKEGLTGTAPLKFSKPIAFNVLPHIDVFLDNGYTKEEMKMVNETRKILGDQSIGITATTVRVPVYNGHSESVNVETKKPFKIEEIKRLLSESPGIVVMDDTANNIYPTALDVDGKDETYIGRIRRDESVENGLNMWVVADNIRKGAATNAVQIAMLIAEKI
jgi:aspartate-semialdehyde dehydrogenase